MMMDSRWYKRGTSDQGDKRVESRACLSYYIRH